MENMEQLNLFNGVFKDKTVLITGNTGFKGHWLALWLKQLGANVIGYSFPPPTCPSHFDLLPIAIDYFEGDINNQEKLIDVFQKTRPEIVFHMAAQPLVIDSYKDPITTFETNLIGSLKVYRACIKTPSVKNIISITTDKVYNNQEWDWGYRESDPLGGKDPYSASKATMEIMSESFRHSFLNTTTSPFLCTVRAGNVIGGGDWANNRLIPDLIRAIEKNRTLEIRAPKAIRPWQHVLNPLSGYLTLAQHLIENTSSLKSKNIYSFNFGPPVDEVATVEDVLMMSKNIWDKTKFEYVAPKESFHESKILKLDCALAKATLDWVPTWNLQEGLKETILWYKAHLEDKKISSLDCLKRFVLKAKEQKMVWAQ